MLAPAQRSLYWRTWSAILVAQGWSHEPSARKDERRYAMHAQAGCPQSMTQFDNRAFDKFLAFANRLLGGRGSVRAEESGERRRLIYRIRQDAKLANLDEAYLRKISTDLTGLACWEELALDDLTNLRNAIHNRAAKRTRKYSMDATPRHFRGVLDEYPRADACVPPADDLQPF